MCKSTYDKNIKSQNSQCNIHIVNSDCLCWFWQKGIINLRLNENFLFQFPAVPPDEKLKFLSVLNLTFDNTLYFDLIFIKGQKLYFNTLIQINIVLDKKKQRKVTPT